MSRGRRPSVAIHEAAGVCSQDGSHVLPIDGDHGFADLIILGTGKVRVVRVRRPHTVVSDPEDVAAQYSREIAELRTLPASECFEKILMLREPGGIWVSYRVTPDSLEVTA